MTETPAKMAVKTTRARVNAATGSSVAHSQRDFGCSHSSFSFPSFVEQSCLFEVYLDSSRPPGIRSTSKNAPSRKMMAREPNNLLRPRQESTALFGRLRG